MTDKAIQEIIDHFNRKNSQAYIAAHPIGENVEYGVVWKDIDFNKLGDVSPYRFYFIKNKKGKCIGAVLDMNMDLHWYIVPAARKKGFLTNALIQFILPHLSKIRKEQIITINRSDIGDDNFEASLKTANLAGFKMVGEKGDKIVCSQKLFKYKKTMLRERFVGISYEQMVKQREKMNVVIGNLWQIKAEVEMKLGKSKLTRELDRYIDKLELYRGLKLDDAVYDFEQQAKRIKR
ncbi:hypothetical protein KHS38_14055 [Mucilaginibacter sp. Bleaf8]|uniref:hypothetical protein n=1 Tax=Mucilaginibacter sp. Bleaf8 TaxID=2834430 RepID=UPI001BD0B9CD|nr:hypothetical protein [Mucilaginibacter sp. Bleaf8]MBS7565532.1 hypothetical protein [Mucilaginibacter sp. Bleaf8]